MGLPAELFGGRGPTRWRKVSDTVAGFLRADGKLAPIYAHSHKYAEQMVDGVLWLNPGSCGKRRFDQEITFAIMTVDGSERAIEKITIPNT